MQHQMLRDRHVVELDPITQRFQKCNEDQQADSLMALINGDMSVLTLYAKDIQQRLRYLFVDSVDIAVYMDLDATHVGVTGIPKSLFIILASNKAGYTVSAETHVDESFRYYNDRGFIVYGLAEDLLMKLAKRVYFK